MDAHLLDEEHKPTTRPTTIRAEKIGLLAHESIESSLTPISFQSALIMAMATICCFQSWIDIFPRCQYLILCRLARRYTTWYGLRRFRRRKFERKLWGLKHHIPPASHRNLYRRREALNSDEHHCGWWLYEQLTWRHRLESGNKQKDNII